MRTPPVFVVAGPHVVADEVDGEVVVINLDNGAYFSFRESASRIWHVFLQGGGTLEEIVEDLCTHYEGEREAIFKAVAAFVKVVEAEGLIAASDSAGNLAPAACDGHDDRTAFVVPTFEKHTDMEDFLLVDPIHEVDVSDWPEYRKRD